VPGEVLGQVVRRLGDPRADDETEPGVLQRVEVTGREHPGISDHDHLRDLVPLGERGQHGDQGGGLGLVALEQVHLEGEPARVDQQPDLDLRVHAILLAHPDPPQVVFVGALEVQRGHVVEDQGGGPVGADRVRPGRRGELPAVVAGLAAGQGPEQRAQTDPGCADLVQDPHDLGLGRRLHDPRQDHRPEPVIAQHVEPETGVCAGQDLPQQVRRRPHQAPTGSDRCGAPACGRGRGRLDERRLRGPVRDVVHPRRDHRQVPEVQDVLIRGQALTRGGQQQRKLGIGMRGAHVLDLLDLPASARDDLDRDRSGGGADLAHEPRDHTRRLPRRGS
jgi:hypothetical protein